MRFSGLLGISSPGQFSLGTPGIPNVSPPPGPVFASTRRGRDFIATGTKTPGERKDYSIDWSAGLGTDSILASSWLIAPNGPSVFLALVNAQSTTAWITGGAAGQFYDVTNIVTTAGGRTLSQTFKLRVTAQSYV